MLNFHNNIAELWELSAWLSSVQFSRSVVYDSVTPWTAACQASLLITNSQSWLTPLSRWCHPTISSSVIPFSFHLHLSQHQGLSQWVRSLHQVAKVLEFQLQNQSFQWIFRTNFLYDGLLGSPCSPRNSQESAPTQYFKRINSSALKLSL